MSIKQELGHEVKLQIMQNKQKAINIRGQKKIEALQEEVVKLKREIAVFGRYGRR